MIVFERMRVPLVRAGEIELSGRRVAARAIPYSPRGGPTGLEFDPIERRFVRLHPDATIGAGPASAIEWSRALARTPGGPVLVGPGNPAGEPVWGAYRAAAEGMAASGRAVYLLDPPADGVPTMLAREFVILFSWNADREVTAEGFEDAAGRGIPAGYLLPLVPGWTSETGFLERLASDADLAGARFIAPVPAEGDGAARRAIVEARTRVSPGDADRFFDLVHHADWLAELLRAQRSLEEICASRGLGCVPPRPVGRTEPWGNAAAASLLEKRANEAVDSEHRASMLNAAARWIDESGRDLRRIAEEGNFRKVFPFDGELAREAEEALLRSEP